MGILWFRQSPQPGHRRRWLAVPVLTLAVVANTLALAGPAVAASNPIPGLTTVWADSPTDSFGKSVTATCPAGTKLVGTGFDIVSPWGGEVIVTKVVPHGDLSGVTVSAVEDATGFAPDWRVRAYARCANPLPGLVRVSDTSLNWFSSISPKTRTASCPTGKNVLGTGFAITRERFVSPPGDVALSSVVPNATLTSVSVRGDELGANNASWLLDAYAICADPIPGLERLTSESPSDSGNWRSAPIISCPEGTMTGAGVALESLSGMGSLAGHGVIGRSDILLFDPVGPNWDVSQVRGHEDERGYAGNWQISNYAICATG